MKKIRHYLKPYALRMSAGLLIKTIGTIAELALPLVLAYLLDDGENAVVKDAFSLFLLGGAMLALALIALFGNIIANRMASKVARDSIERIRNDLFTKTLQLSARQTDSFTIPTLISRLSSDTYNVHNMLGMMQRLGVRVPIMLFGGLFLAFFVEPVLTLILIAVLPVMLAIVILIARKGIVYYGKLQRSVDGMVRKVRDDYTGVRVIKALSRTETEARSFRETAGKVAEDETKAGLITGMSNPIVNLLLNLGMVAVVLIGALRVRGGEMSPGKIVAFVSYFTLILNAAMTVSRLFVTLAKGTASGKRICEVLNSTYVEQESFAKPQNADAHIAFENVTFAFSDAIALNDVSFFVRRGEKLGIIGATGSGKSTIVQLLLRFYAVNSGGVFVDGQNVNEADISKLREKFGIVFQNDFIMRGTVEENVDFCRNLPRENILRALQTAQANFVAEKGLDFPLEAHGVNLSGGQKQRILIARALAGDPDILILDDSSSALDYKTDAALRAAIAREYGDTTVLYIAQRVSSVRGCDKILVLDGGRAVGFGSHAKLCEQCGIYRDICASQGGDVYD